MQFGFNNPNNFNDPSGLMTAGISGGGFGFWGVLASSLLNFFTGNLIANSFNTSQSSFNSNSVNTWNSWTSNATMNNMNPQQVDSIGPILSGIGIGTINFALGILKQFEPVPEPAPGTVDIAGSFGIMSKDQIPLERAYFNSLSQQGQSDYITQNVLGVGAGAAIISKFTGWAGKHIGRVTEMVNPTNQAILKNGYYEVNGFKFSKYYYNKLWTTGRGAPSLVANEILQGAKTIVPDVIKKGFFR